MQVGFDFDFDQFVSFDATSLRLRYLVFWQQCQFPWFPHFLFFTQMIWFTCIMRWINMNFVILNSNPNISKIFHKKMIFLIEYGTYCEKSLDPWLTFFLTIVNNGIVPLRINVLFGFNTTSQSRVKLRFAQMCPTMRANLFTSENGKHW